MTPEPIDGKWLNYAICTVIVIGLLMMFAESAYKAGWKAANAEKIVDINSP